MTRFRDGARSRLLQVLPLLLLSALPGSAEAQAPPREVAHEVFVGSELERYLRVLQVSGRSPAYPWSLRGFSHQEVERMAPADTTGHPWQERYRYARPATGDSAYGLDLGARLVRPAADAVFNSAFPRGGNDGAVWAGKGFTGSASLGTSGWWGPLSVTVAPVAFRAQNGDFELADTNREGRLTFADPLDPTSIDRPQRFGGEAYARVDAGQSAARLDLVPWLGVGISTANQQWGPAHFYPIILGNNGPGFIHAFAGTAMPLNLWIGHAHGRFFWGRLEQSEFAFLEGADADRFMAGAVGVFTPRGLDGLELGFSRFFHQDWEARDFFKPFEAFLESGLGIDVTLPVGERSDPDNQLASLFFRWVFPESGVEVYGEYGREDRNADSRDLILEPDHDSGYTLGIHKVWAPASGELWTLGAELTNARVTHLDNVRNQTTFYRHSRQRQGHTHRGQLLGSPAVRGGAGFTVAIDRYHVGGRWGIRLERELRMQRLRGGGPPSPAGADDQDVLHSLTVDGLFFRGPLEMAGGLTGTWNQNRNFGSDEFNLRAFVAFRAALDDVLRR